MFGKIRKNGDIYLLQNVDKARLPIIYKEYPYWNWEKNKKVFLWDYLKIDTDKEYLEIKFFKFVEQEEKLFVFSLLSSMMKEYEINLVGMKAKFDVHPKLKETFGEVHQEEFFFTENPDLWYFSPEKEEVDLIVPAERYLHLQWVQKCKVPEFIKEKYTIKVPTQNISFMLI